MLRLIESALIFGILIRKRVTTVMTKL